MKILFISYAEVSLRKGNVRAVAMVRALADAGHRVDLVAPMVDIPEHPHIRVLALGERRVRRRYALRMKCLHAVGRGTYDAVHAVDDAVFFAARLGRWKRIPLVYDASRRFTGSVGVGASRLWSWFPGYFHRLESKVLEQAEIILSPCTMLSSDLQGMNKGLEVVQLEDVPAQSLYARSDLEASSVLGVLDPRPEAVVVCCLLPGGSVGLRNLLLAARKVVDSLPNAAFFFGGARQQEARKMAESLDIAGNCVFLSSDEPEKFIAALEMAHAVLMVPQGHGRYIHPQVYTLLQAGVPLVAVQDAAYDEVLTDKTSVRVLSGSDSIAEGLLRVIQEPLFSLAIAIEGQQLVADRYTYSSFKHKVRMTYHRLAAH